MNNMLPCTNKITIRNIKWMIITTKQKILTIIIMNLFNKTIKFILTNNIIINIKVKQINNITIMINTNIGNKIHNNITKSHMLIMKKYILKWKCNLNVQMINNKLYHNIIMIKMMLLVIYLRIAMMMINLIIMNIIVMTNNIKSIDKNTRMIKMSIIKIIHIHL